MRDTSEAVGEEGVAVDVTNDALALVRAPSKVSSGQGAFDDGALPMMREAVVVLSEALITRREAVVVVSEALITGREAVRVANGSVIVLRASLGRASASS